MGGREKERERERERGTEKKKKGEGVQRSEGEAENCRQTSILKTTVILKGRQRERGSI